MSGAFRYEKENRSQVHVARSLTNTATAESTLRAVQTTHVMQPERNACASSTDRCAIPSDETIDVRLFALQPHRPCLPISVTAVVFHCPRRPPYLSLSLQVMGQPLDDKKYSILLVVAKRPDAPTNAQRMRSNTNASWETEMYSVVTKTDKKTTRNMASCNTHPNPTEPESDPPRRRG